jgi:hypothetical protein
MYEETGLTQLWWCWARRLVLCDIGNSAAPAFSRLHGFAVRQTTLGVRFHSCSGPRVALRLLWDTEDGTPVPKHVGFDTYRELYCIVGYGLHLLVYVSNKR